MLSIMMRRSPSIDSISRYLKKSEASGKFSNFGPCNSELKRRLGLLYGVGEESVCLTSSATTGLSLCLLYLRHSSKRQGSFRVALPSWSFAATAQAVVSVGATPVFIDVNEDGLLSPSLIEKELDLNTIDAVLPVIPFGRRYEPKIWEDFQARSGVAVIIDAAACFSTAISADVLTVVSTHATKFLSTGEGGYILCNNYKIIETLSAMSNFGFTGTRESTWVGMNGKMSEYAAAVGLAYLDDLVHDETMRYSEQVSLYRYHLKNSDIELFHVLDNYPATVLNVKIPSASSLRSIDDMVFQLMSRFGIESRRWWHLPLHLNSAFNDSPAFSVNGFHNTINLYNSVLGIPVGHHLSDTDIKHICASLNSLMN
jgi:dTDP-4-amino-4,6-dideoxygalactose transaminase